MMETMKNSTVNIYYIIEGIMDDDSTKYVRVNPECFSAFGEERKSHKFLRFCMTDNKAKAEPFTDKSYVIKNFSSIKENIKEKGNVVSLRLVEVYEEIVVTTNYEEKDILWEKKTK